MPSRWLKLTVAYDGGAYAGWQIQPDQPTVQGTLQAAWQQLTQERVNLTAAGRTDAGVHALGQVVGVSTETRLTNDDVQRGLNALLPEDVVVVAVENAPERFHATYDAVSKRYRYHIHNSRTRTVFDRRYTWHVPHPLDVAAMHTAGQALIGRHDFSSFESAGSERPDPVRTITELTVARGANVGWVCREAETHRLIAPLASMGSRGAENPSYSIAIEVSGDGFLYNMVRAIVGTLLKVGRGTRDLNWPAEVLAARDRRRAGQTAPPHGLFLVSVEYDSCI
jgi:tRNA pseudouridine38-40 synthase